MDSESSSITIVGASARAAAFSALRAGFVPWCLDLFADLDLAAAAEVQRCPFDDYPQRLPEMLRNAPAGPVIYTGGLENHPLVVDKLAAQRQLWGNTGSALVRSRDPFFLAQVLSDTGLPTPALTSRPVQGYLRKPRKGAGGAHIRFAESGDPESESHYFQKFIPGPAYSAVFCSNAGHASLLGVTRQLTGETWLNAKTHHYCGSIGPVELPAAAHSQVERIGGVVSAACGMRGLFGVDFILDRGSPWLVEVNPRYTASIEVLEYAMRHKVLEHHRRAFVSLDNVAPMPESTPATRRRIVGKAILFAPERLIFPGLAPAPADSFSRPDFADIPRPGEILEEGWPILTLLAEGTTIEKCWEELRRRAAVVRGQLQRHEIGAECTDLAKLAARGADEYGVVL